MSNNIFFERGQMADKPKNYLWNGDCLELMKDIPDKSMDAIICDLPYGTTQCKWDSVIPFDLLWNEYNRVIKDKGAIILFSAQPFTSALISSNYRMFKYSWTWDKSRASGFLNAKKQPLRVTEDICVFYKKQCTYNPILIDREKKNIRNTDYTPNKEGVQTYGKTRKDFKYNQGREIPIDKGYPKNLLHIKTVGTNSKNKRLHPTQKPLELLKYLVKTYTNENDWVLDNTCGSNTTGIACYDLNRNYIGIEKDIDIYEVAKKRVEENILLRANKPKTLFEQ